MPRYRFQWTNLPPSVLRRLKSDLDLGRGQADRLLRQTYGARPGDDFVRDAWPTLLESWLGRDSAARRSVVSQLRARKLGEFGEVGHTVGAEIAYLRTCRNGPGLREVVLDHLISAGERAQPTKPTETAPLPARPPTAPPPAPADESAAWAAFTGRLAESVAALEDSQFLILSVRRHLNYFVQFAADAESLRSEVVSDAFLEPWERLGEEGAAALSRAGWTTPTKQAGDEGPGSPNWYRDWSKPAVMNDVAKAAVNVLTDIFEVRHPANLTYRASDFEGGVILLPGLGLARTEPATEHESDHEGEESEEDLRRLVDAAISEVLEGAEVIHDEDGDIPLQFGKTSAFVRVSEESGVVEVFAPVVYDLPITPEILAAVNECNQRVRFLRFVAADTRVDLRGEISGSHFAPDQLIGLIHAVGTMADEQGGAFQERFGGTVIFGAALPPREAPTGGYL